MRLSQKVEHSGVQSLFLSSQRVLVINLGKISLNLILIFRSEDKKKLQ